MTYNILPVHPSPSLVEEAFQVLKENAPIQAQTSARFRIEMLDHLYAEVWRRRDDLKAAMWADFKKPPEEVDLTEIFVLKNEIKTVKRNLRGWMRHKRVPAGLALVGSASWIRPEAKGVVLIISPWNYPMQLVFRPLVAAIAAGCTAMIKPSELTENTAQVVAEIVSTVFDQKVVSLVQGGVDIATHLLTLPFNHIYFTGSPPVGKIVMAAAAKIPCSVTLELGGKSPVVVDGSFPAQKVADRLAWSKLSNAGQICVAPDYVLVHAGHVDALTNALKRSMKKLYADPGNNKDYQRIVKPRHAERIGGLIQDAVDRGAQIVQGGDVDVSNCFIAPTILADVPSDARILHEEIFGPVLPIVTWHDSEEIAAFINSRETPLALYIYSNRRSFIDRIMDSVPSGGVSINNSVVHVSSTSLPFGGLGPSGIGSGHGEYGFREFTHMRGVYEQRFSGAIAWLMPPYTPFKSRLINVFLRWL